jgi:hypothetical protein
MKILFLCGSLEYGKDGVGDYTRRLAGELIRQGHSAYIISLNDRFIKNVVIEEQKSENTNILVLRLPSGLSNKEKYSNAGNYIKDFNPEWLSLQYVPYSFQKKGLPFSLAKRLAKIGKDRKWHIMFHELWIGMNKEALLKHKIMGFLQQFIIKKLIEKLSSKVIHTNTTLYQLQLKKLGVQAQLLPLFGNIPVRFVKREKETFDLIFIIFGSIHYGANVQEFTEWLLNLQQIENKIIKVFFAGKNGTESSVWKKYLQEKNIYFKDFGFLDEANISKLMLKSDIGIITTPYWLVEKSGSMAAMQEHGLPVICVSQEWIPRNINESFEHSVIEWEPDLQLKDIRKQSTKAFNLQNVAKSMLDDIRCH